MILSIIVAASENGVIGNENRMIWHLSEDLKRFKRLTMGHPVIMGRKTYESIGRPLPGRRNIVVSHRFGYTLEGCEVVDSIETALRLVRESDAGSDAPVEAFVIGGAMIYNELWGRADRLYLTLVHACAEGDAHIPAVDPCRWREVNREEVINPVPNIPSFSFIDYVSML